MHLLMDESLVLMTVRDVNINAVLLGWAVMLASLSSRGRWTLPAALRYRKKKDPTWNCSQQGVWIIFGNQVHKQSAIEYLREGKHLYGWYLQNKASHNKTI